MKKFLRGILSVLHAVVLGTALLWCAGLWCYQPISLVALGALIGAWGAVYLYTRRRPKRTALWLWGLIAACITLYCALPGPCPAQWQRSWEKAPVFAYDAKTDTLAVFNLRDFRYRTVDDFDSTYRHAAYDLKKLTGVDFAECHWDGMEAVCHTMMSFRFSDGRYLVISPETRLPVGEAQNAIGGLYKRYGLLYVFGTEEDIFALRTDYRHEDLYLMPMKATPQQAREMLLQFVAMQEDAARRNASYNTVSHNCSTGIVDTFGHIVPNMPAKYYLLPIHNGSISRILFEHGAFHSLPGESYEDFRKRTYLGYDLLPQAQGSYSQVIRAKIAPHH